jgi:hypothetical protein
MPITYAPQAKSRATDIDGTPIEAVAAVECLSLREVLRFAADNSLDVDHLLRLDNSVSLPAVPFNLVVDGATYSVKAAVRGCGRVLSQLLAKKS